MKIEVLYFDDCPSYRGAVENVREALRAEGVWPEIELIPVRSEAKAQDRRLVGSPTIRINGVDLEGPEAERRGFGLGCRVYIQADGRMAGGPSVERVRAALRAAAAGDQ